MSKFFIVFCIALFASATFGAPRKNDQRINIKKGVKNLCTRIIYQRFSDIVDIYQITHSDDETETNEKTERLEKFISYGSNVINKLVQDFDRMELIDDTKLVSIYPGAPVYCPETVLKQLSRIESELGKLWN